MKHFLILFLSLLLTYSLYAQTWQWSNSAGGTGNDQGTRICSDLAGNIYMKGSISSYNPTSVYFKTDTLTINGYNDFFIAKYDINGTEVWVKKFGGANTDLINITSETISDLIFDSLSNSIYAVGRFYGTCTLDSITLNSCGGTDIFFAKFDLNGNCVWAKKGCSVVDDSGSRISLS